MEVIDARNVNDAYQRGLALLVHDGERHSSRAGDVLSVPFPVTTVYACPQERVLFDENRDANPFFHLFEALWMLAGRNDATWLDQFVGDFSARFAEEDGHMHGAYGFRWRNHFDLEGGGAVGLPDQLTTIANLLRDNPDDRRVVLQMWDPIADLGVNKRDVPCNIALLPRIVEDELDITVFCRSNDAVWGAYGANAVHFSILQEYLAAKIGVPVGRYYQISNNFHVYLDVLAKVGEPKPEELYIDKLAFPTAIVSDPVTFDEDLTKFLSVFGDGLSYHNRFFPQVAVPMLTAHRLWKAKQHEEALKQLERMPEFCDWRVAAERWFRRRMK